MFFECHPKDEGEESESFRRKMPSASDLWWLEGNFHLIEMKKKYLTEHATHEMSDVETRVRRQCDIFLHPSPLETPQNTRKCVLIFLQC